MKSNAYIVELKHKDNSFTSGLDIDGTTVSANLKKIGKDLFTANFKNQVEFRFMEKVTFKSRDKDILVLTPVLSKYNKRRLTRISKILAPDNPSGRDKYEVFLALLGAEKYLKAAELLDFFSIDHEEMTRFLLQKELQEEVKVIGFSNLTVVPQETLHKHQDHLDEILTDCFNKRTKSISLTDIETRLKLSRTSLLFKYLLRLKMNHFSFRVGGEKLVFQKVALTENEKGTLAKLEDTVLQNNISIFTIEALRKLTALPLQQVNDSIWFLVESGQVVRLDERFFIMADELEKIFSKLKKYKRNHGDIINIQAFRELTLFSRKFIIPLFEYFDANQITERIENERKILLER